MSTALLSVIIGTYRHGKMLYETLDSIFSQTYEKIQVIVAEDGATDFSAAEVRAYIVANAKENIVDFVVLQPKKNRGTVKNLNNALRHARGEYIKIIAGDDTFDNDQVFQRQVDFLEENRRYLFVVGNVIECDAELNQMCARGFSPDGVLPLLDGPRNSLLKHIVRDNPGLLSLQAMCCNKTFYQWLGEFDESYRLVEDLPMAVKAISCDIPFGYIDFPCVKHRGVVGVSTSKEAFDPRRLAYYEDLLTYYDKSLAPVADIVGKTYVRMRRQLIQFRIDYAKLKQTGAGIPRKLSLILKNIIPVSYYSLTQFKRVIFYFSK